jgi:hypothetical protein
VADKNFYSLHFGVDACVEDRLPCKGVSSDRPAWWQAWHVGIDSAVEARSILLLVPFVEKLARILRPNIKTNWWKIQVCCSTCLLGLVLLQMSCVYSFLLDPLLFLVDQLHSLFVFFSAHLPPQKASLMCGFAGRAGVVQVLGFCQK